MIKLIAFLLVLIGALQYRLWLGDGGIKEWQDTKSRIEELKQEGERRKARNAALEADVRDLKAGTDAIEERARQELGMVREGETFVQVFDKPEPPPAPDKPAPESRTKAKPKAKGKARPPKADKKEKRQR